MLQVAFQRQQCGAHLRHCRNYRRGFADGVSLQRNLIEMRRVKRTRRRSSLRTVVRRVTGSEHCLRHCAIKQPGVEMAQAVMGSETLAERPLAGRCRPIDGDDHESSAPSERISSAKPGKLVAINAASSTCTGCSLPSPITSADIAIR